ncbi:hypothetical protein [Thiocystis violacea]|uniref:hypothetical protein n=1 Tax=Thiocystis violacea TaxID=13725 RepID=UPI0019030065|nr:hypothetical protein [Thiocystis violacea]MBK1722422.1 hypothetical protein [Thiocystis violacea]
MNLLARPLLGLAILIPLTVNAAGLGSQPAEKTCEDERNQSYSEGFTAGDANGYERGYPIGFYFGAVAKLEQCVADPFGNCGIPLSSCIPDATYGETEPNDNFITADKLTLGVPFSGQNYGGADQDWFYTETTAPNQNIIVNFSVPASANANLSAGLPAIWNVSVRDAAGNVFANYYTNFAGGIASTADSVTYSVTLGLVGSYYVMIQPADKTTQNAYTYALTAFIQDTTLDNKQPIVGFYDTEVEPNNVPSHSNPLATGVSMYGLINLTFNTALPGVGDDEDTYVWGQGEDDWYVYKTDGNELVTLTLCAKEACGPGNWFIEIYDQGMATRWESGEPRQNLTPLLSFNTDTTEDPSATFRIGFKDPGYYFMRVNHKRLFTAPCLLQQFNSTTSDTGFTGFCECEAGNNSCYLPADCSNDALGLVCNAVPTDCVVGIEAGCAYIENSPPGCGVADAEGNVEACDTYQTQARCACSQYGGVVEVPENQYTSPYNFTWHGTQLPTNTIDTDAYEDYLNRPNPYN